MAAPRKRAPVSRGLHFVRYGIPFLIFLVGCVLPIVDSDKQRGIAIGSMFVGAAFAVILLNFFFRIGVEGDKDRDREEAARRFYDEHGQWPYERP
jgi:hypothetical protein